MSQWVSDKHFQWLDSGPIKIEDVGRSTLLYNVDTVYTVYTGYTGFTGYTVYTVNTVYTVYTVYNVYVV